MCGIVGIVHLDNRPVRADHLQHMMQMIKHRGPDDEGCYVDGHVGLGHLRLSIIDLSASGKQPMVSDDGRYHIIYNGEIYNYIEIRKELEGKYPFVTKTDTEVILAAYKEWGERCLEKFNGMWALAIYDGVERSLFLSRDRYGIKPLYYFQSRDLFVFASEMKPLYWLLKKHLAVNQTVLGEYLLYNRTDQTTDTFIGGISRFQHGWSVTVKDGLVAFRQWYDLASKLTRPWASPEEYKTVFTSAVQLRMRSDVPVGICLSGGFDSSGVTSVILNGFGEQGLHTFSAVYGAGKFGDERPYIDLYKPLLQNLHYVHPDEKTLVDDFDAFMDCHFEPVSGLSIYSQYKVLKDASRFVTVLLDGQGADEQLGGYHYFFGSYFKELLLYFKWITLLREVYYYLKEHQSSLALQYLLFYLLPGTMKKNAAMKKVRWIDAGFFQDYAGSSHLHERIYDPDSLMGSLQEHFEYKLEHNLKWNDLNSMYFSLELRVPFLDNRIVEKTLASSSSDIIRKGYTKWIYREAMQGVLPERIRTRQDKVGFANPADEWMKTDLIRDMIEQALVSSTLRDSGYINMEEAMSRYQLHLSGKVDASQDIWKWINLYYFLNRL